MIFSFLGSYVNNTSLFDVGVMFVFGLVGYLFTKLRLSLPTMIVAFFLGSLLEHKIRQSLIISRGDWTIFIDRPIACCFFAMTVFVTLFYIVRLTRGRKTAKQ